MTAPHRAAVDAPAAGSSTRPAHASDEAGRVPPGQRALAAAALAGMLAFLLAAAALQFVRTDLDWVSAQMSFYLLGPGGRWLQAAYCMMGLAIVLLALGLYRAMPAPARSAAPVLLFVLAGAGLAATAFAAMDLPDAEPTLVGWLHGVTAYTAFLCVTAAMLLQSWRFRGARRWRRRTAPAMVLAATAFAGVWMLALWPALPRGLAQKAVIAAIGGWLVLAACWLLASSSPSPARIARSPIQGSRLSARRSDGRITGPDMHTGRMRHER